MNNKNNHVLFSPFLITSLCFFVLAGTTIYFVATNTFPSQTLTANAQTPLDTPLSHQEIQKTYTMQSSSGTPLTLQIYSAEKKKSFILDGSQVTAIPGKAFLIIHLKYHNPSSTSVTISPEKNVQLASTETKKATPVSFTAPAFTLSPNSYRYTIAAFLVDEQINQFMLEMPHGDKKASEQLQIQLQ